MPNVLQHNFGFNAPPTDLRKVTIIQQFGKHTLGLLDFRFRTRMTYTPATRFPVQVRWGTAPVNLGVFYGYFNHYEKSEDRNTAYSRLVTVGTSQRMNTTDPRTWNDSTASAIARDFATKYKMRSIIHDHPWVMDTWSTGTRSDWKSLLALAEEIGYEVWVDGASLYFLDPAKVLTSASNLTTPRVRQPDILDAKIFGGNDVPDIITPDRRKVSYGLDYTTNEFFESTSGSGEAEVVSTSVTTFADAQQATKAGVVSNDFGAVMTIKGNAKLHPGSVVAVDSGRVSNDQGGLWMVVAASHVVTRDEFNSTLTLRRGSDVPLLSRVSTTLRGAVEQVPAVVRDGATWESSLQEHVHV